MLNKSENALDMRKSDVYQRIAHHINVKSQENTSGIVRNKLSSDSKSERDGRKLWEKNLFRMCFCICMEYIYYAGCLIKSKRKYRKVQPSLWMCVFAQQCPDRKNRQRDKKIQREKKWTSMEKVLLFAPLALFSSHKMLWMPSNTSHFMWCALCLYATLRFVFMSKAHFLF